MVSVRKCNFHRLGGHILASRKMGLFSRQTKKSGWMAISFQTDGIYAAYAQSAIGSRPTIE